MSAGTIVIRMSSRPSHTEYASRLLDRPRGIASNGVQAASVVLKQASRGGMALIHAIARVAPENAVAGIARILGPAPAASALLWAAVGEKERATKALWQGAVRHPNAAVKTAILMHDASLGRALAQRGGRPLRASTSALLLLEEGEYEAALAALGRRHRRLRDVIEGERDAFAVEQRVNLDASWDAASSHDVRRVMHLVTTALPEARTGYTYRSQGIGAAQAAAGKQVVFVSRIGFPVDRGVVRAKPVVQLEGVEYRRLLGDGVLPLRADRRLDLAVEATMKQALRYRPDLLHAHSKHDNAQVALAVGHSMGIPVVYEVRGFLEETWRAQGGEASAERYRLTRQAETRCMGAADAVITLSESMRSQIVARGIDSAKVHVVPNAVGESFLEQSSDGVAVRRRLGIPPDAYVVGMAGTLNAYEGIDTLFHAVAASPKEEIVVLIVGDGPASASLRDLAAELEVDVRLPGRVPHDHVRSHIAAMDLFCVPRKRTPVTELVPPLKPIEALATGVPVLASDLPPLTELGEQSPAVECVPSADVPAWTSAINHERSTGALASQAAQAQEWVCTHRTWEAMAQPVDVVYAQAIERRARMAMSGRNMSGEQDKHEC